MLRGGWEARRATGASHSHALLYYAFLRFFSPLPSSLVIPPRTFRFSSSSSSDLANARPSFPSPSHPLRSSSLRAWLRVQSLTFHRARLIAVALTYCIIRCTRSAFASSWRERSPRAQNAFAYLGMRSRENCVYSWTSARRNCEREGR